MEQVRFPSFALFESFYRAPFLGIGFLEVRHCVSERRAGFFPARCSFSVRRTLTPPNPDLQVSADVDRFPLVVVVVWDETSSSFFDLGRRFPVFLLHRPGRGQARLLFPSVM